MVQQLSGLDAAFVTQESRETPMHVSAVLVYAPNSDTGDSMSVGTVISAFENVLAAVPFLTQKLKTLPMGMDEPYWVHDSRFELKQHVSVSSLGGKQDWGALKASLARLHAQGLNMKRPLWSANVITGLDKVEGIEQGSVVMMLKVHHACIDGVTLASMISNLHMGASDVAPASVVKQHPDDYELWGRATLKSWSRPLKLADTVSKLIPGMSKVRELETPENLDSSVGNRRTRFNDRVSRNRVVGAVRIPIESVKQIKRFTRGVTFNDIAVSVVGGALRSYLLARGELPRKSMVCGAPVSLRTNSDKGSGNKLATMQVGLATDLVDPVARLRAVHQYAVHGKKKISALGSGTIMDISDSLAPVALAEGLRALNFASTRLADMPVPFHVMISNVPGPQQQMSIAEYPLQSLMGLGPVRHSMGLFHIVIQTATEQTISFASCYGMMPDPEAYEECLEKSVKELVNACS